MRKTWSQRWNIWEIIIWNIPIIEKKLNSAVNTHRAPDTLDSRIFIDHKGLSKYAQYYSVFRINLIQRGGKGMGVGEGMSWLGAFMELGHTCQLYNVIIGTASHEL